MFYFLPLGSPAEHVLLIAIGLVSATVKKFRYLQIIAYLPTQNCKLASL